MKQQASKNHSAQSRSSFLRDRNLRLEMKKIELAIVETEKQILELEAYKVLQARGISQGLGPGPESLDETIAKLASARGRLDAHKQAGAQTQLQIKKVSVTPAQVQARLERQGQVAKLASERLEKDRQAVRLLEELRTTLSEREELTSEMAKSAALIGLTVPDDGLDARFKEFLPLSSEELLSASERWCAWFLGKQKKTPYIVVDALLTVPETLGDHGVYEFGELIPLTEEDAHEFLRKDRPVKNRRSLWECVPPSVMTREDYQSAIAEAKERGITLDTFFLVRNLSLEEEARKQYQAKEAARLKEARELVTVRNG